MIEEISYEEIEELGTGIVVSFWKRIGVKGIPDHVDIEAMAESMGFKILYDVFAENDKRKVAYLSDGITPLNVIVAGEPSPVVFPFGTIVMDKYLLRKPKGMRNFTIAHEIAHFVLQYHDPIQLEADAEEKMSEEEAEEIRHMIEKEADHLAAAILMPGYLVNEVLDEFNDGDNIPVYGINVFAREGRDIIKQMADKLHVSFTALARRLREFRMLEPHQLCEYTDTIMIPEAEEARSV